VSRSLIQICLLAVMLLPAVGQAQFNFTTNTDGSLNISLYTGSDSAVVIPDTTNGSPVTSIGTEAFSFNTNLNDVTIGSNISTIGFEAFYSCTTLDKVTMPVGVSIIGVYAFAGCHNLASLTIPNTVTNIGDFAFMLSGLTSIYFLGNAPSTSYDYISGIFLDDNVTVVPRRL
jgi:hypothetical protein